MISVLLVLLIGCSHPIGKPEPKFKSGDYVEVLFEDYEDCVVLRYDRYLEHYDLKYKTKNGYVLTTYAYEAELTFKHPYPPPIINLEYFGNEYERDLIKKNTD